MYKVTKELINKMLGDSKIELYEGIAYDTGDDKTNTLSLEQLNAIYDKACQEGMSFKAECIMTNDDLSYYEDELIEDLTDMYIEDGEDECDAEGCAIEEAHDIENEADSYVEYFLEDKHSKYSSNFSIKEVTEDEDIIFTITDKVNNFLENKTFSEIKEPTLCDDNMVIKVTLFK